MKEFMYEDIKVNADFDLSEDEMNKYMDKLKESEGSLDNIIDSVSLNLHDDGYVNIIYNVSQSKFDRIRRITGYMSGTLDRWNPAKQAEERDRVKHC